MRIDSVRQVVLIALVASLPAMAGQLSGTIKDDQGYPISGALVEAQSVALRSDGLSTRGPSPRFRSAVATSPTGAYTLDGLPPGNYYVCVYSLDGSYLSNCEWGLTVSAVPVHQSLVHDISLRKAQALRVIVRGNLQEIRRGARLRIIAIGETRDFSIAKIVSNADEELSLVCYVPAGELVRLFVDSDLTVSERTSGARLPPRVPIHPVVVKLDSAATVELQVQ